MTFPALRFILWVWEVSALKSTPVFPPSSANSSPSTSRSPPITTTSTSLTVKATWLDTTEKLSNSHSPLHLSFCFHQTNNPFYCTVCSSPFSFRTPSTPRSRMVMGIKHGVIYTSERAGFTMIAYMYTGFHDLHNLLILKSTKINTSIKAITTSLANQSQLYLISVDRAFFIFCSAFLLVWLVSYPSYHVIPNHPIEIFIG